MTQPRRSIVLDYYFDAICPWSYIGKRRLEGAIAARADIDASINWQPFLLNPELPPEGIDRTAYLIRKFGSEQRIQRAIGSVTDAGHSVEIDFAFDRIDRTPNTLNAHRLVRLAQESDQGTAAVEALFHAYFVLGLDIGNEDVLFAISERLGLDSSELIGRFNNDGERTAVFENNARAHRLGINGSPSVVFPGSLAIAGAQEPAVLARMLDVVALSMDDDAA